MEVRRLPDSTIYHLFFFPSTARSEDNNKLSAAPSTPAEWSIASSFRVEQHLDDVCLFLQLRRIGSDRLNPPTDKIVALADPSTAFVGLLE